MDKQAPPPEAVLLTVARKAAGMKTPDVARAAGISKARLSQIENGYERRAGRYSPVRGKDDTIAHVAAVVGVTPEQLEEARRPDAALILREILRRDQETDAALDLIEQTWGSVGYAPEFIQRIYASPRWSAAETFSLVRSYIDSQQNPGGPGSPGDEREPRSA